MTAPALLPEFNGNVTAVPTAPFWSEELGAIAAKHEQIRDMVGYVPIVTRQATKDSP